MRNNRNKKLQIFSISLIFLFSACSVLSDYGLLPASTNTPAVLSTMTNTLQSAPSLEATVAVLPSATTSLATPSVTTTTTVTSTPTTTLTPTSTTPSNAPYALSWTAYSYTCAYAPGGTTMTMDLNWSDPSNAESGFRVYRDNAVVATLAQNTTRYVDVTFLPAGNSVSYFIEIYNPAWQVRSSTITYSCN